MSALVSGVEKRFFITCNLLTYEVYVSFLTGALVRSKVFVRLMIYAKVL